MISAGDSENSFRSLSFHLNIKSTLHQILPEVHNIKIMLLFPVLLQLDVLSLCSFHCVKC